MTPTYEEIKAPSSMDGGEGLLAIIIRSTYFSPIQGAVFFTPPESSQQVGILNHKVDTVIPAHIHRPVERVNRETQEVLIVRSGIVKVTLYLSSGDEVCSRLLYMGDTILLASGGHKLEMLTTSQLLEIKTGNYVGKDADKMPLPSPAKLS